MKRLATLPLLLAAILGFSVAETSHAAGPSAEVTIENVRVGLGDGPRGGWYKSGTWTPIWVDLKGGRARFEGVLEVTVPDDNNTPTKIRRAVNVAANEMATIAMFVRPGTRSEMGIRVVGKDDRTKANWNGGMVEAFGVETAVIATAGLPAGVGEITQLAKYTSGLPNGAANLLVTPIRPRDGFPARWYSGGVYAKKRKILNEL